MFMPLSTTISSTFFCSSDRTIAFFLTFSRTGVLDPLPDLAFCGSTAVIFFFLLIHQREREREREPSVGVLLHAQRARNAQSEEGAKQPNPELPPTKSTHFSLPSSATEEEAAAVALELESAPP
jgi:hypothetical protein